MAYKRCPIVETIFDIGFENIQQFHFIAKAFSNSPEINKLFPKRGHQHSLKGDFEIQGQTAVSLAKEQEITGYIFSDNDLTLQLRIKNNGISFHQLGLYPGYDIFISRGFAALELFLQTKAEFEPFTLITKIAIRTINKIRLPQPLGDFNDYITTMPPIPDPLPDVLSGMFTQIKVPYLELPNSEIAITQTFEIPKTDQDTINFILDIDALHLVRDPILYSKQELQIRFEMIHKIKNEVFESCITDKTRNLFNQ
jgi:uncharacterized protein (TIGR04255 family)